MVTPVPTTLEVLRGVGLEVALLHRIAFSKVDWDRQIIEVSTLRYTLLPAILFGQSIIHLYFAVSKSLRLMFNKKKVFQG